MAVVGITDDKQAKILEFARKRIEHYGISKTTMADIAQDADMAVGTIYLYFKNKGELVLALAQECRAEQEATLQGILQRNDLKADEKLELFFIEKFRHVMSLRHDTSHTKDLIAYLVRHFPEAVPDWEQRFEQAIQRILEQGIESDLFHINDVQSQSHLLRVATQAFFLPPYIDLPVEPNENDLKALVQWLMVSLKRSHV